MIHTKQMTLFFISRTDCPIVDSSNTQQLNAKTNAPDSQGIVSATAVYNGSGLYHSVASDPASVIVSNSSLLP
ncbi:MAG: hypothetical protein ACM3X1_00790 [Ignavibacteriales bacterium]